MRHPGYRWAPPAELLSLFSRTLRISGLELFRIRASVFRLKSMIRYPYAAGLVYNNAAFGAIINDGAQNDIASMLVRQFWF